MSDITRTIDDCHGDFQVLLAGLPDDVRDGLDEFYDRQAEINQAELDVLEMQHAERECERASQVGKGEEDAEIAALHAWYDEHYREISDLELNEVCEMINQDKPTTFSATIAALEKLHANRRVDRLWGPDDFDSVIIAEAMNTFHDRYCRPIFAKIDAESNAMAEMLCNAEPRTFSEAMELIEKHRQAKRNKQSTSTTMAMAAWPPSPR